MNTKYPWQQVTSSTRSSRKIDAISRLTFQIRLGHNAWSSHSIIGEYFLAKGSHSR
ncbi:MAG: hypothetical protein AVDCRST_MAG93-1086 [uncultured Chloroflexia bacterium]|uniref:Uncharacterized protein n=1 Tax=uncultured Chloroflexia bacterium TaxID=1672391 RepID=A0A6J4HWV9_9CHLR|nr:MAG: hypothetical protein AVDCRST_MAG93-1086 [uncultured Chloroflexia bacterium]